ncbi:MAG: S1 RNA-binding domain-containing protein [Chloroflexota bacterium]|nr:S1 RNA-binding domain-containing protein [Chloroflexota bacterium]
MDKENTKKVTQEQARSEDSDNVSKEGQSGPSTIQALKPGMRLKGTVQNIVDFGAFIDIGVGRDGLAHISTLKRAGIDETLHAGDEIDVQIRHVDVERDRISLTIPGAGKSAKTALENLKEGSVVTGRVVRLVDFGAFIDIGARTDGLLHISEFTGGYIKHPSDVLNVGEEVEVRILDVDTERQRISLSMKEVEKPAAQPVEEPEQEQDFPTAFEVAWQQALSKEEE